MKTITKICLYCNEEFEASLREHKRGNAKYCCKDHSCKAKKGVTRTIDNVTCAYCGINFHKSESKQSNSKSGLFFCCREHKDLAQQLGGIEAIQPDHYKTGESVYREKAFNNLPHVCAVCGYNKYPQILAVHHIDMDRSNNRIENLELLCGTCHDEKHFLTDTGKWTKFLVGVSGIEPPASSIQGRMSANDLHTDI